MQVCRFKLNKNLSREQIEEKIAFAVVSAECTFGQAKVRLNAVPYARLCVKCQEKRDKR